MSTAQAARTGPSTGTSSSTTIRKDIQALRAFAVLAVVLYHLWPNRLPGGYAGVDIFFVISGYLITGQILREIDRSGRIRFLRFYARRARRLLPAASIVLLVSAAATVMWAPYTVWHGAGKHIAAAAAYVENWALAAESTNYLAADDAASPAQHYWSLSVEEQFYLLWPALVLGAALLARRYARDRSRAMVTSVLALVAAVSLALSIWYTRTHPDAAYFATFTRLWEFAAGGLLAAGGLVLRHRLVALAAWLMGGILLVASLFVLDAHSEFPGSVALIPVAGAALMIAVDLGSLPRWIGMTESWAPVQLVGDVSYGMYLWHWPLIVLYPYVAGSALTTTAKLAIAAASVLLAWMMKVLVEDPIRGSRTLRLRSPAWSLAGAAVLLVSVGGVGIGQAAQATTRVERAIDEAHQQSLRDDPCRGAAALVGPHAADCSVTGDLSGVNVLDLAAAAPGDKPLPWARKCIESYKKPASPDGCVAGDTSASRTIVVFGDSHAAAWVSAFDQLGITFHYRVLGLVREACPPVAQPPTATPFRPIAESEQQHCAQHNQYVLDRLRSDDSIAFAVAAARTSDYLYGADQSDSLAVAEPNYVDYFSQVAATGVPLDILRELPQTGTSETDRLNVPDCLASHPDSPIDCSQPRGPALSTGVLQQVSRQLPMDAVTFVDTARYFCDDARCYALIGGLPVYFDSSHLTDAYARSTSWGLAEQLGLR